MHAFPDGSLRPIMYVSSSFTPAETNYPQIQKEAAALQFAIKRFHKYIYGRKFELQTDHKPLLAIFGCKDGIPIYTASRLQRYALTLLAYDFTIKYVSTTSFGYADVVSRLIAKYPKENEDVIIATVYCDDPKCLAVENALSIPIKLDDIQSLTYDCPVLKKVVDYIKNGWPNTKKQIQNQEVSQFFEHRHGLLYIDGCVFLGD